MNVNVHQRELAGAPDGDVWGMSAGELAGAGLLQVVQLIGPRYREDLSHDAAQGLEERLGTITPIDPKE